MDNSKRFLLLNVTWTHSKVLFGCEALCVIVFHQKGEKIKKEKCREFESCFVKISELRVEKFCMILAKQWFSTSLNVEMNLTA